MSTARANFFRFSGTPTVVSMRTAAKRLGLNPHAVRKMVDDGILRANRDHRTVWVSVADIDAWKARQ